MSSPDCPNIWSFSSPPLRVSAPPKPRRLSLPLPPVNSLFPLLPVKTLSEILPVAFIFPEPVRVRFSTLSDAVKVTEENMVSLPLPSNPFSMTVSLVLSTIYLSLPPPPLSWSIPTPPSRKSFPSHRQSISASPH